MTENQGHELTMNNITHSELESGSDVCPSCKSDSWKSAKMVVMEGTTTTTGTLDGKITDPGKLSGSTRDFLLGDRWFSWTYPIETEVGLTSSTSLVEEVKGLMVDHGSKLQMPSPPIEPTMPMGDTKFYFKYIFNTGLMMLVAYLLFVTVGENATKATIIYLLFLVPFLVFMFKLERNKKQNQKKTAEEAMPIYKKKLAEYEEDKKKVIRARELLWERARICMRCGKAYLAVD